jgi:hypothetical protein
VFISGYLREFYTRCVVVQMKKVHINENPLELSTVFQLLGYEGFSDEAFVEVQNVVVEKLRWSISLYRVDPTICAFFRVGFFLYF